MNYVSLIAAILEEVLGLAENVTSGQVQNIINILEKLIPIAVQEAQDLLQPIENIINQLSGSGVVTAAQIAQLQVQSATIDAALDNAAGDDKIS